MNEMTLTDNLQQLMRIHGNLSVSDLSRLTNIPQPTLHHILSGATKKPRKQALEAVADFFSISIAQLLGEEPLPHRIPEIIKEDLKLSAVPIIQWDMLKNWPINNLKELHLKEVVLDHGAGEHFFALVVQDSLLEPLFSQNNLLIFDRGRPPKDRDFVIVHTGKTEARIQY